jgi:hypothetical protein
MWRHGPKDASLILQDLGPQTSRKHYDFVIVGTIRHAADLLIKSATN